MSKSLRHILADVGLVAGSALALYLGASDASGEGITYVLDVLKNITVGHDGFGGVPGTGLNIPITIGGGYILGNIADVFRSKK